MITPADILRGEILIVDDQIEIIKVLELTLRNAGYVSLTTTMAPDGVSDLYRRNNYDLILLDLQMPGMDGFQVMESLRPVETEGYLPVLVLSAQPDHRLRALKAGAKDFITKPFDLAEVLTRVRNMLEVRLLHKESKSYSTALEKTLREVEASREVIRRQSDEVRSLYDQVVTEQKLSQRLLLNVLPDAIPVKPDEEIRQLVPEFLDNRKRDVGALRAALGHLDFKVIKQRGHELKEIGRGYGFDGVTEIGSALERAAHHEDHTAVETRIQHLSQYLQRVQVME